MFKDNLKLLRLNKGATQAQVAKSIGVSAATIGNYEQGNREPRSYEMWIKLADYFNVSVDVLMDKKNPAPSIKSTCCINTPYRTDIPILYDGEDITSLVLPTADGNSAVTKKQIFAYVKYSDCVSHFLYARKNLLDIISELKIKTSDEISAQLNDIISNIQSDVVYWYQRCWNNIDDLFPEAYNMETLYSLLNLCLRVDMIGVRSFTLLPVKGDFDWMREKLRD